MMATKDCVFMKMYEELYKLDYQRDKWYYNGGELPTYALLDQYPGLAFVADEGVHQGKDLALVERLLRNTNLTLGLDL